MISILKKGIAWRYSTIVLGSVFLVGAALLALALFSFNPLDSSWFYHNSSMVSRTNILGFFGAQIAALFFYVYGFSSWLVVFLLVYSAYLLIARVSIKNEWDRVISLLFMPITTSALCFFYAFDFFDITPGGVLGASVYNNLVVLFDPLGAVLFLHALLFVHMIIIFQATFVRLLYGLHSGFCFVSDREKFLRPAFVASKKVAWALSVPFIYAWRFVQRLFGAEDFLASDMPIVSFEQQLVYEVEELELKNDPFWQKYMGDDTSQSVEHVAGATHIADEQDVQQATVAPVQESVPEESAETTIAPSSTTKLEHREYQLPNHSFFKKRAANKDDSQMMSELKKRAKILEEKLERFGVYGSVTSIKRGPVVTLFEYRPQIDTKISKIIALEDDLALALQAMSIRIIAPIPGKSVVGFEVANLERNDVLLSSIIQSKDSKNFSGSIPLILGDDTVGNTVLVDLATMPHLLIAGSTGSGKSVALNAFLVSMLCALTPDELKLVLIDPKRLEFSSYADIPHLLFPIVTDPKRTAPVLKWVVNQMEERYEKMSQVGARNIFDYNELCAEGSSKLHARYTAGGDDKKEQKMEALPFIVIIIDELADLMMTAGRDIEGLIARIAQMARAAGIHMIIATQRPSVDVITGLIKVNFPSRISFRVTSRVDSRTILDCGGAEKLLGFGDMLFLDSRSSTLRRLHGAYVSSKEIDMLASTLRAERAVEYLDLSHELMNNNADLSAADDVLYKDVMSFLETVEEVSISLLQRKFKIGYNRSARIIDLLESRGLVMPSEGSKMRKVIR